jgi:hypothetical protein
MARISAPTCGQGPHVFGVQAGQLGVDALGQAVVARNCAERVGRGGKASGHAHTLGSCEIISPRLAFLPPTDLDVGHPQVFKRYDQAVPAWCGSAFP